MSTITEPGAKPRRDLKDELTTRMEEALRNGTVPWRRPWSLSGHSHHNPITGNVYRGNNPMILALDAMDRGYTDPRWVTKKQAGAKGWQPTDGRRWKETPDSTLLYYKRIVKEDEATGERKAFPMLRMFWVVNVAELDHDLTPLVEPQPFEVIDAAQSILDGMPDRPTMRWGGDEAFYFPARDRVQLPSREQFDTPEAYYSVAFHELAHSTGHERRLNRDEIARSNGRDHSSYAREELTAEMTAAMLAAHAGIDTSELFEQSAAYIACWLKHLTDDRSLIAVAAARAQRAVDFILDVKWEND